MAVQYTFGSAISQAIARKKERDMQAARDAINARLAEQQIRKLAQEVEQRGQLFPYEKRQVAAGASMAETEADVSGRTAESRVSKAQSDASTSATAARVASSTADDVIAGSAEALRAAKLQNEGLGYQNELSRFMSGESVDLGNIGGVELGEVPYGIAASLLGSASNLAMANRPAGEAVSQDLTDEDLNILRDYAKARVTGGKVPSLPKRLQSYLGSLNGRQHLEEISGRIVGDVVGGNPNLNIGDPERSKSMTPEMIKSDLDAIGAKIKDIGAFSSNLPFNASLDPSGQLALGTSLGTLRSLAAGLTGLRNKRGYDGLGTGSLYGMGAAQTAAESGGIGGGYDARPVADSLRAEIDRVMQAMQARHFQSGLQEQ